MNASQLMGSPSRRLFLLVVALIVVLGVFVVPWYVPSGEPNFSDSYTYGFSNFAAWLCIAIVLLALTLRGIWGPKPRKENRLDDILETLLTPPEPLGKDRPLLWAFGIVLGLTFLVIGWWYSILPYAYFGESRYFLTRLDQMILGLKPYADFEYHYGPATLYPALWLYKAGFFSVEQAYIAALLVQWAAGLYCLYSICRNLGGAFARATVFVAIAIASINIHLGPNCSPLRFALPMASILFFHRAVSKAVLRHERGLVPIGMAFFLTLLNFAVSPEMGLAVALALSVYFIALLRTPELRLSIGLVLVAASMPATALVFSPDYFFGVFSFGTGGGNFPIFPTIHIVAFLAVIFWILPGLGIIGFKKKTVVGAGAAALYVLLGLLIIPALGRCDGLHVYENGIGALLLFLAVASLWSRDMFPVCVFLYVMIFPVCWQFGFWSHYAESIDQVWSVRDELAKRGPDSHEGAPSFPTEHSPIRYSKLLPFPAGLASLQPFKTLAAPFGCDESMERFLKMTGQYVAGYFLPGLTDIYREADVKRQAAIILRSEYLIVPGNVLASSERIDPAAIAAQESSFLSNLLLLPINLTVKNKPFIPEKEVYNLIAPHYTPIARFGGYVILRKQGSAGK